MYPIRSQVDSSEEHPLTGVDLPVALAQQRYRSIRRYRTCVLVVLTLIGLSILATGGKATPLPPQRALHNSSTLASLPASSLLASEQSNPTGSGAGARTDTSTTI